MSLRFSLFFLSTVLAFPTFSRAEISPGELLIAEMNCVACHEAAAPVRERLASRRAPHLGAEGVRATPQWLRAFLADLQSEKPGTLMPDTLHTLPAERKAEAIEALTHFLVSIQPQRQGAPHGANAAAMETGERLYQSAGCVQCHAPAELPPGRENTAAAWEEFERLKSASVPLGDLAKKFTVTELAAFLRDPLQSRPAGRMPGMKLAEREADAIAMWLLRGQSPGGPPRQMKGLQYEYYEKDLPELPEFDRLKPDATGVADTISLKPARRKDGFALRFTGALTAPTAGEYKFYLESDDGSRLFIDGKMVVENGGLHSKQTRDGTVHLEGGPHAIVVTYFDAAGERALAVSWKGPELSKQKIPASALSHDGEPMTPLGDAPFAVDEAKAARGANYFVSLQCARCHDGAVNAASPAAKPLAQLTARQPAGCIAASAKAGVPKFQFTDRQRAAIQAALSNQAALSVALDAEHEIRRTMTALNCYACHGRDRRGGAEGLRREYFTTAGEVDLGDEGRIPPSLTAVGAKLRPEWMHTVLAEGGAVRPYMAARMPQFGAGNVARLPALFETADARPEGLPQPDVFAPGAATDANKFGRKLVGIGGLSCIACHTFDGNKSLGVPALDLATAGQRLKWDWFRRYLLDPQSLRPGTRMPAFWPGGVAVNKSVLDGDAEKQIFAIWAYLARKNFTSLPDGLVQGRQELLVSNEAVIYRNFIDGGGPRAIGVGYPEKVNLAFDADEVRLALLWQGPFIDAARHWSGRGEGFEKPLGGNLAHSPPGAPFAVLDSQAAPWPSEVGAPAGYQFGGYRLDDKRRPTFLYSFHGVRVEDYPLGVPGEVDGSYRRTLTFCSEHPPANLYFRAAVDDKIDSQPGGAFLVGDKMKLTFPGAKPAVRRIGDKSELLVPVVFAGNEARIVEEIVW